MKVITRGTVYEFECEKCGCVFVVGKNDDTVKVEKQFVSTNVKISCKCPCCDAYCANDDFEEVEMDGGYTRFLRKRKHDD